MRNLFEPVSVRRDAKAAVVAILALAAGVVVFAAVVLAALYVGIV